MNWYVQVLRKYAVFSGRARRTEYWMFVLVNLIVGFVLGLLSVFMGLVGIVLAYGYSLAILLPSLAVQVRRLHDGGRSGWWIFIEFIPIIGAIILLIYLVQDSQPGENKYGPNPKNQAA